MKDIETLANRLKRLLETEAMGIARAIKIDTLALRLGVTRRDIELAAEGLRDTDVPVCSSTHKPFGLYMACNHADAAPFVRQMKSRLNKMSRRIRKIERRFAEPKRLDAEPIELELFA